MDCRSIDTAPKDQTSVLAFGRWGWEVMGYDLERKAWVTLPGYWEREPTHWAPLPEAPGATEGTG
jgi:hypothetical protein